MDLGCCCALIIKPVGSDFSVRVRKAEELKAYGDCEAVCK